MRQPFDDAPTRIKLKGIPAPDPTISVSEALARGLLARYWTEEDERNWKTTKDEPR